VALAIAALATTQLAPARAAQYKMLLCAGNVGHNSFDTNTNTKSPQNPGGIFDFPNGVNEGCGQAPDPAGNAAFLRISENQTGGLAGQGAFGQIFYDTPPWVHFKTAGGYTREPNAFNPGWRARFMGIDFANNTFQMMTQGLGLPNQNGEWLPEDGFGSHVWPFPFQLDFHRFIYELICVKPTGCDRTNFNAVDANTFLFTLSDDQDSQAAITSAGSPFLSGDWVKGTQSATWTASDQGSGIYDEFLRIDGAIRYHGIEPCNVGSTPAHGEFARVYRPCTVGGPFPHVWPIDTASLADGSHTLSACTRDYGQFQGLSGTGGESCDARTIHVDNTAPDAPPGLEVTSANPARYLDHFSAHWSLTSDPGSPIAKVHYEVINKAGEVVVPEKTISGTNLTQLPAIEGPKQPGEYRLRLRLEDSVGLIGPATTAPSPHDVIPPAAPQEVSVTSPNASRAANGFDLRWRNITDAGSPIVAAHYQVLDDDGQIVVPTHTVNGDGVQAIADLDAPGGRGAYSLRLWLSDGEGNVGAPATVPLAYECQRSEVAGGANLSAGLGKQQDSNQLVQQGEGSLLKGRLAGKAGSGVGGASVCVFSRVITHQGREFLGLAVTGGNGEFRFAIPAGASRELSVDYRAGHRELSSQAQIETVVHPTFRVNQKVIHNKHTAFFVGHIPGPDNDNVLVNAQVRKGKGWLTFRRYRTRANGMVRLRYRFTKTLQATKYRMRAQVRKQSGYAYHQGNSRPITLIVRP
jgi:hypothetical protein